MSAQLEVLFSDAQETLEQIELESHTLEPGGREKVKTRVTSYQAELKRQQNQVASSKTEAGERSDRLELLSRPGHGGGGGEEFQGGENSLLLAESEEILSEAGRQLHDGRRLLEETQEVMMITFKNGIRDACSTADILDCPRHAFRGCPRHAPDE